MRLLSHFLPRQVLDRLKEGRIFLVVGFSNAIFTYIIYLAVNLFTPYIFAYSVSFCSGILFSAYCNSRFSFSTTLTRKRLVIYALFCMISYFIGVMILKFLVERFHIHEAVAPIIVVGIMVPFSFLGTRLTLVGSLTTAAKSLGDDH